MNSDTPSFWREKLKLLNCCVIIPTYNNEKTLQTVITNALQYCHELIIVNDGSTDSTSKIIENFPGLQTITYTPNKGKGYALKNGLKKATELGYRYAITMDSDGQHFAEDIPAFMKAIEEYPDSLLIGARNLQQENMPKKNTFGNKFSNFWFRVFTGIAMPDTQSGFRLYPLRKIKHLRLSCNRYELEMEIIVRAAWSAIEIRPVPIRVFYPKGLERVTHFRPTQDFSRITLLNIVLFFPAILFYRPLLLVKKLKKKNLKDSFKNLFLSPKENALHKSSGVAFGVFMGIIPIWGYQLLSAVVLAHFLKLNKAIVALAANISIPPMIPLLLYGSLKTGQLVLNNPDHSDFDNGLTIASVKLHLKEYLIGSVIFAAIMALTIGFISFLIIKYIEVHKLKKELNN